MIELLVPTTSDKEKLYLIEAIEHNQIAQGDFVQKFETLLSRTTESKYAVATSSGTAALHIAYIACGMKRGSRVIMPTCTFAATAFAAQYIGAQITFLDIDDKTLNIDLNLLIEHLEKESLKETTPEFLVTVDLFGNSNNYSEILKICNNFKIKLIIDGSEALGSKYNNQPLNKFSNATALSFNGNKIITTGGGGALLTDNEELSQIARHISKQSRLNFEWYEHDQLGFNYRLSNLAAAVGFAQLENFDETLAKKALIHSIYQENLDIPYLSYILNPIDNSEANFWLNILIIQNNPSENIKLKIYEHLRKNGIQSRSIWKPLHMQAAFKDCTSVLNGNSEKMFNSSLCLPSSTNLTLNQQQSVIRNIQECFGL